MKLVFLGTAASTPTKERGLSSVALQYEGEWLLFDAPENVQRQMMAASVSYMKVEKIFISHWHADHVLGLPGLIATMSMHERDYPLYVYGPRGVKERVEKALELGLMGKNFEVRPIEVKEGVVVETEKYTVRAARVKHDVPNYCYVFQERGKEGEFQRAKAEKLGIPEGPLWRRLQKGETVEVKGKKFKPEQVMDYSKGKKGRKVSYVTDTLPDEGYFRAIEESDVLVHEATFSEKHRTRAKETMHCTAAQAGKVADRTRCKALYLTHVSARYKDASVLEHEAAQVFGNVKVAEDLMEVGL